MKDFTIWVKKKLGFFPAIARVENTVSLNLRLLSSVTYSQLSLTSRSWGVFAVGGSQFYDSFYGWTFRLISISFIVNVVIGVIVIHNKIIFGWKKHFDPKVDSSFYSASQVESTTKRTKHGETTSGNRL